MNDFTGWWFQPLWKKKHSQLGNLVPNWLESHKTCSKTTKQKRNMVMVRYLLVFLDSCSPSHMGVSENSVPLNPMVLLIIIPIKWLFHWEYTQHFQTNPYGIFSGFIIGNLHLFTREKHVVFFHLGKLPKKKPSNGTIKTRSRDAQCSGPTTKTLKGNVSMVYDTARILIGIYSKFMLAKLKWSFVT